jgi:hypothetical protein
MKKQKIDIQELSKQVNFYDKEGENMKNKTIQRTVTLGNINPEHLTPF